MRTNLAERERELATGSYFKNVDGNLPLAMAAYRRVLQNYPDDETALTNLANLYTAYQRPNAALKLLLRAVKTRPRFAAYSNLFNTYIRLNQLNEAEEAHRIAATLYPDQKRIKFQPIILAVAKGDLLSADRHMDAFLAANANKPELANDLFVARYQWKRGRIERARAIFRERARMAATENKPVDSIEAMTSLVAIARAVGSPEDGRSILDEIATAYPLAAIKEGLRPYIDLAEAHAMVGEGAKARHFFTLSLAQSRKDRLDYDQNARVLGLVAMAEGRDADAVTIFKQATRFGQCSTCLLYDLALAQEKAGLNAEAIQTYQAYAKRAPFALGRGEYIGFVLARLANLQEQSGDINAAQLTRQKLNRQWVGSDSALFADVKQLHPPVAT